MSFVPGDVVVLKSGGLPMTVESVGKDERTRDLVSCVWFETIRNRQELHREEFSPIVIEKYEPSFGVLSTNVF